MTEDHSDSDDVDATALGLAPLSASFSRRWQSFYRGVFRRDCLPGKRTDDGFVPHPIYGVYVINDYLSQAEGTGDRRFLEAASRVAYAVVARLSDHRGSAVLWYEPDWRLSSWISRRHYSALTQSYYARAFARLASHTGDPVLLDWARRVASSLLISTADGGVRLEHGGRPCFEEAPTSPASLILNGWQSTLVSLWNYAGLVEDNDIRDLTMESARGMLDALPCYDLPDLLSTRYSLAGYIHARVVFDAPGVVIEEAAVEVDGYGRHQLTSGLAGTTSRWQPFLFDKDLDGGVATSRQVRMNLVLSRVSWPAPNRLHLTVRSGVTQRGRLQLRTGRYSPLTASPVDLEWRDSHVGQLLRGRSRMTLALDWEQLPMVGYPTNFIKKIDGVHTNVYHELHCRRLSQLSRATGLRELEDWSRRWDSYRRRWADSPVYSEVRSANAQTDSQTERDGDS